MQGLRVIVLSLQGGVMNYKDYRSEQENIYRLYRPRYPKELFAWVDSYCNRHGIAWDCAAGNGQVAQQLAQYFRQVIATDVTREQIAQALPYHRVEYRVAKIEDSSIEAGTIDCIAVAQALHYFNFEAFYQEVRRVAAPEAVIVVWFYPLVQFTDRKINHLVRKFCHGTMKPYWPPEMRYIDELYESLPFPFEVIAHDIFHLYLEWDYEHLIGYLQSCAAVQRCKESLQLDPVAHYFERPAFELWGDLSAKKELVFDFPIKIALVKS